MLGASIGLAALFLYLYTASHSTTGETVTILFGSAFAIASSTFPLIALLSLLALAITITLYRPLLLATVSPEMAAARGIPVRTIGILYLIALALAAALAAITIGSILGTALLVGPAASALRLTKRPLIAMLTAAGIGIGAMWLGIVLAYDSYEWPPAGHGWPISFFVVTIVFILYLLSGLPERRHRRRGRTSRTSQPSSIRAIPREEVGPCFPVSWSTPGRSRASSRSSRASSGSSPSCEDRRSRRTRSPTGPSPARPARA